MAGRTHAYSDWGYRAQATDDWLTLIDLARKTSDPAFLAETIVSFGVGFPDYGLVEKLGREALPLARNLADKRLLAQAKMMIAWGGRFQEWRYANEALQLAQASGDRHLIFEITRWMATWARYGAELDRPSFENLVSEVALLAQESGSFYEQAYAAQVKGWYETDLALALAHFRQAFNNFQVLGNQFEIDKMANSIGLRLLKLGLYRRALAYANLAVEGSRRRVMQLGLPTVWKV